MNEQRPPARLKAFLTESLNEPANAIASIVETARAPLSMFVEDPSNPRTQFDPAKHRELVDDIKERGLLQPIVVICTPDGKLMIRHGARRFRAAKEAGLDSLPYALQTDARQLDSFAQIAENEIREDHTPLDLARFVEKMVVGGMQNQDIAAKLHKPATTITYLLSLASAPPFILELYQSDKCTHAESLYRLRMLWEKDANYVESRCAVQETITDSFIRALRASMDPQQAAVRKKRKHKKASRVSKVVAAYRSTSPSVAKRSFHMNGQVMAILSGGMIVRRNDGTQSEIAGDDLAELILAAHG
jgi:ParB/RepB/Spo0J family partition protein